MSIPILIFGSTGQFGVELVKALSPEHEFVALTRQQADLANEDAVRSSIRNAQPEIIINAAAYTAVDRAESEPELAHVLNAAAPGAMAEEARRLDAWLIHISTDYVFDGSGKAAWREVDLPHPLNVYGQTKLEGELAVAAAGCRHLIFRTSWVYASHGSNFVRTMLRLSSQRSTLNIVDDQIGAPTSAIELARGLQHVLARLRDPSLAPPDSGVYHMTCRGTTSWFGFAKEIFIMAPSHYAIPELVPITSDRYLAQAKRPHNSALSCDKLERTFGITLALWQDALAEVMLEIASQPESSEPKPPGSGFQS